MEQYWEYIKYFLGTLPGVGVAWYQHRRNAKSDKLKEFKDFMIELQSAFDQILDLKKKVIVLSVDLNNKTELVNALEKKVEKLTIELQRLRTKYGITSGEKNVDGDKEGNRGDK